MTRAMMKAMIRPPRPKNDPATMIKPPRAASKTAVFTPFFIDATLRFSARYPNSRDDGEAGGITARRLALHPVGSLA